MTKANKKTITPKACSDDCARAYLKNATEVRRLLARLTDAAEKNFDTTFGHVRGEWIDYAHVSSLAENKYALRELCDRVFREGEYAE